MMELPPLILTEKETPCIEIDEKKYDEMLSKVAGQSFLLILI